MGASEERTKELEAALKVRDELLSVAAHELRTPLGSLRLYIDGLVRSSERGTLTGAELALRLKQAGNQIDRLEALLNNLLDFSRVRSGRLSLVLEPLELAGLAGSVADRFRDEFTRHGRVLEVHATGAVWGDWDRLRLEQVLTNLLSNALKHAPRSPVRVLVVAENDHQARLIVADQGPGILPEERARIFERFTQLPSTGGGLGIGLWIVAQIVEALGGTIRIESEVGRGASFIVELPRHTSPQVET
jgi:signal transduction histidine kinase